MAPSEFKQIAARVVLGASLLDAAILGARTGHNLYELRQVVPEETIFFHLSGDPLILALITDVLPVLLYLGVLFLAKKEAWSRFGRTVAAFQGVYILVLIAGWIFVQSFMRMTR